MKSVSSVFPLVKLRHLLEYKQVVIDSWPGESRVGEEAAVAGFRKHYTMALEVRQRARKSKVDRQAGFFLDVYHSPARRACLSDLSLKNFSSNSRERASSSCSRRSLSSSTDRRKSETSSDMAGRRGVVDRASGKMCLVGNASRRTQDSNHGGSFVPNLTSHPHTHDRHEIRYLGYWVCAAHIHARNQPNPHGNPS